MQEIIEHVSQTQDNNCVSACLAMLLLGGRNIMQRCTARINNHQFGVSKTVESVPLLYFEIVHTGETPMFDTMVTRCDELIATLADMRERALNAKAYHELTGELYGEL